MSKHLTGYELQNAIIGRLSALSDLQTVLQRTKQREDDVRAALLAAVPEALRQFVEDEGVVDSLFRYGRCSTNLVFERYNLKDFSTAKRAAKELQAAWVEQVTVRVGTNPEPHRVDIIFGVAQL